MILLSQRKDFCYGPCHEKVWNFSVRGPVPQPPTVRPFRARLCACSIAHRFVSRCVSTHFHQSLIPKSNSPILLPTTTSALHHTKLHSSVTFAALVLSTSPPYQAALLCCLCSPRPPAPQKLSTHLHPLTPKSNSPTSLLASVRFHLCVRSHLCRFIYSHTLDLTHHFVHLFSLVRVYFHSFTFILTFAGSTLITRAHFHQYVSCTCLHPPALIYACLRSFIPACTYLCPPAFVYVFVFNGTHSFSMPHVHFLWLTLDFDSVYEVMLVLARRHSFAPIHVHQHLLKY